jgi:2-polyprenyl-6-methoxyphenol hydroxylase-like FAD-dependent oxidoreductase
MRKIGDHAVVLGASMGGLLAARVLADAYRRVTVIDRDLLPERAADRQGVPQGRHAHGLLARGAQILDELFPGLLADLAAAGVNRRGRYQADRRPRTLQRMAICPARWPRHARPLPGQGPGTGLVAQPALVRALAPGAALLVRGLRSEGSRVGGTQLAGGVHAAGRASGLRRCLEGQP